MLAAGDIVHYRKAKPRNGTRIDLQKKIPHRPTMESHSCLLSFFYSSFHQNVYILNENMLILNQTVFISIHQYIEPKKHDIAWAHQYIEPKKHGIAWTHQFIQPKTYGIAWAHQYIEPKKHSIALVHQYIEPNRICIYPFDNI